MSCVSQQIFNFQDCSSASRNIGHYLTKENTPFIHFLLYHLGEFDCLSVQFNRFVFLSGENEVVKALSKKRGSLK